MTKPKLFNERDAPKDGEVPQGSDEPHIGRTLAVPWWKDALTGEPTHDLNDGDDVPAFTGNGYSRPSP